MTAGRPLLTQLNLVVGDMDKTVAFYRLLGLAIDATAGSEHVAVPLPNGVLLEFDSVDFVPTWEHRLEGRDRRRRGLGLLCSVPRISRQPVLGPDRCWLRRSSATL